MRVGDAEWRRIAARVLRDVRRGIDKKFARRLQREMRELLARKTHDTVGR